MEFTCRRCEAKFRAAIDLPPAGAVRLGCPWCGHEMLLRPGSGAPPPSAVRAGQGAGAPRETPRHAIIADEPRPFRAFLAEQLRVLGFEVSVVDNGDAALDLVRRTGARLLIVNVYLKGKLGVEVTEQIRNDRTLSGTCVILIGALFRANRFRANPTNLYGADEYIEEQIPEKEFRDIVQRLLKESPPEDEGRRLARLILSDIIIDHPQKAEEGIRGNTFFEALSDQIEQGRRYYQSRGRPDTEVFIETLRQFVRMKREEMKSTVAG